MAYGVGYDPKEFNREPLNLSISRIFHCTFFMQCVQSRSVQALKGYINRVNHNFSTNFVESQNRSSILAAFKIAPGLE
jgi:hypothetical protein